MCTNVTSDYLVGSFNGDWVTLEPQTWLLSKPYCSAHRTLQKKFYSTRHQKPASLPATALPRKLCSPSTLATPAAPLPRRRGLYNVWKTHHGKRARTKNCFCLSLLIFGQSPGCSGCCNKVTRLRGLHVAEADVLRFWRLGRPNQGSVSNESC